MNNPDSPTPKPSSPDLAKVSNTSFRSLPLGEIVATTNAISQVANSAILIGLGRHACCDWGEVCPEDWELNDYAYANDQRVHSVYSTGSGLKFWIITEWDRSITTILMPEDY